MKKLFNMKSLLLGMVVVFGLTACGSDDDNNGGGSQKTPEKETAMSAITTQYVNNVISPIYKELAAKTSDLFD